MRLLNFGTAFLIAIGLALGADVRAQRAPTEAPTGAASRGSTPTVARGGGFFGGNLFGDANIGPGRSVEVDGVPEDLAELNMRVELTSLLESRNSNSRGAGTFLSLTFNLNADALPLDTAIRRFEITEARDDQGRSIAVGPAVARGRGGATSGLMAVMNSIQRNNFQNPAGLQGNVTIGATMRSASALQYIEGFVELYLPNPEAESAVAVPDIISFTGSVESDVLDANQVVVRVLDQAESATAFGPQVAGSANGEGATIALQVVDPASRVAGIQVQDERGNAVAMRPSGGSFFNDQAMMRLTLLRPPPPDAKLVIYLATDENVRVLPFRIEDIPLP